MAAKLQTVSGSWILGCSFHGVAVFLISILVTLALYFNKEIRGLRSSWIVPVSENKSDSVPSNCNIFSGVWVYDNKSLPLYKDRSCSFMFDDFACEKYGRENLNYQYWRWQPHNCDLPMFNAKALLERLRGKRLVFVGDSLNKNQWVSLICLVESSIPSELKSRSLNANLYSFTAKEYNARIDFYWAPLLVESNSDDPSHHHLSERIVRLNSIEKHARHWGDADILVFNSYLWWKMPTLKVVRESLENPNASAVYEEMQYLRCYKEALKTWSKWLLTNANRRNTQFFWISASPTHTRSQDWGMPMERMCYNETQVIRNEEFRGSEWDPGMMRSTEAAIQKLKARGLKIEFLNITRLSEFRKDGHPTIYKKHWRPLTQEQLANPLSYADCTHWCLPGVPDVWNQILYSYLLDLA